MEYTVKGLAGIAELNVMDARFTANYDREMPDAASFLRDAIKCYTSSL